MNYSVISFLEERLKPDHSVFEYGSGYSTVFFARLAGSVTAVEHDGRWLDYVRDMCPGNTFLKFKDLDEDGQYCRASSDDGLRYQVVVVDGRDRNNCLAQCINALAEDGVVLLDDLDWNRYESEIKEYIDNGFRILEFEGMKPTETKLYRSALLYRDQNCLGV